MADIDLKTETPDTSLPSTGFLFGADSQSAASPSVYSTQAVATALLGSTSLTGATVTADAPVINASQTWNSSGTTFTGLKLNVTDTASAAASLLMDLQVGGASAFNVSKSGSLKLGVNSSGTNIAGSNVTIAGSQGTGTGAGGSIIFQVAPAGGSGSVQNALATVMTIPSNGNVSITGTLSISSNLTWGGSNGADSSFVYTPSLALRGSGAAYVTDCILTRDAANTLALRNGANAQAFRVYNTTDGTNSEFGKIAWSSNVLQIGTEKAGTGTARALEFQTDGTTRLTIAATGQAVFSAGSTSAPSISFSNTGSGTGFWGAATSQVSLSLNGTEELNFQAGTIWFKRDLAVGSGFGVNFGATGVTTMGRDGANYCIAVGNGANAFRFSVYNTYTNATTFERYDIDWRTTANTVLVGPTKGSGGGTQRTQRLQYLEDGGTGSTTPSLGTTCPAASATIKSWIKVVTSDGTTGYIPCWA